MQTETSELENLPKKYAILQKQCAFLKAENAFLRKFIIKNEIEVDSFELETSQNEKKTTTDIGKIEANKSTEANIFPKDGVSISTEANIIPKDGANTSTEANIFPKSGINKSAEANIIPQSGIIIIHDSTSINKIVAELKHKLPNKMKKQSRRNIASEIICVNNNPNCNTAEIKRVTTYSASGFGKNILLMRRLGLLVKTSSRTFGLTNYTKDLIQKLFGVAANQN